MLDSTSDSSFRVRRARGGLRLLTRVARPKPVQLTLLPEGAQLRDGKTVSTITSSTSFRNNQNTLGKHEQASPRFQRVIKSNTIEFEEQHASPSLPVSGRDKAESGAIGRTDFVQRRKGR